MTEENTNPTNEAPAVSELEVLKAKAKLMGISHSPNIGVDALREKINAKLNDEPEPEPEVTDEGDDEVQVPTPGLREYMRLREMKLIRLRITNLDPKKSDLKGEYLTFANKWVGTITKFIPFGEESEDGWHVPFCIYKMLDDRKFLQIKTTKNRKGEEVVTQKWVKEYSLEVLKPLTKSEIEAIKQAQVADGGGKE